MKPFCLGLIVGEVFMVTVFGLWPRVVSGAQEVGVVGLIGLVCLWPGFYWLAGRITDKEIR